MKASLLLTGVVAAWTWSLEAVDLFQPDKPNAMAFAPTEARFVRLVIHDSVQGQPCIDELEVYGPEGGKNLALASAGAKATASSCLLGYAIHQISHLNDGRYGNSHSWIAAGTRDEWAQIELPKKAPVAKVVFSRDREGRYRDRMPARIEIRVSVDGTSWKTVARGSAFPILPEGPSREEELLRYAFECEDLTWRKFDPSDSLSRVLRQMEEMLDRFSDKGLDVSKELGELAELRRRQVALRGLSTAAANRQELLFEARLAKRRLFLREPELATLERILFVKRHPFEPSHNYSVILDAAGGPGGGICTLEIPRRHGCLEPGQARVTMLFESGNGIARNPVASFDATRIYFGYRPSKDDYFHLWMMNADGSSPKQITDGPFHDYFPCPLPDGGLAFISTRCKARFLCWRPQAFVLFRMDADGSNIQPLISSTTNSLRPFSPYISTSPYRRTSFSSRRLRPVAVIFS